MAENLVEINDMSFVHENGHAVYRDINIQIPTGKITAILGPSGTGKTTLLRLMSGQIAPSKGLITVAGQNISKLSRKNLFIIRKKMGMLFQAGGLFTHLNVYENVAFPLREHTNLSNSMINTLVLMKLQMVGLRGARDLMPSELSGGMARRVALARAVALDPNLMLYDEPFTGQDPISMGVLIKLIKTLNSSLGITSVLVSHDVQEALALADYIYIMANGSILAHGKPEVINKTTSAKVQQFIQGLPDGPVPFDYPAIPMENDFFSLQTPSQITADGSSVSE